MRAGGLFDVVSLQPLQDVPDGGIGECPFPADLEDPVQRFPMDFDKGANANAVFSQKIPFTNFPLPKVEFYVTDKTILLPSEY